MSLALDIRNLGRRFGPRQALDQVTLAVEAGECFGLLGPNGGGKSTLFRILSTLLQPSAGSASIFGADTSREPSEVRAMIGVVFQSPSLDKKLSVLENLGHHGRLFGLSGTPLADRCRESLKAYGL